MRGEKQRATVTGLKFSGRGSLATLATTPQSTQRKGGRLRLLAYMIILWSAFWLCVLVGCASPSESGTGPTWKGKISGRLTGDGSIDSIEFTLGS